MTQAEPRVSIVVACRNESGHIHALLESIVQQTWNDISWEAILADGMSADGTRSVLQEYSSRHPQIRMVDNPEQIVSTGLNRAIRSARGDIIIRMDAHTKYAPDYCLRSLRALENTGAANAGGPARTEAIDIRSRAVAAAYHSRFSTGGAHFHDTDYEGWVDTVPYGCWRKATLEQLGLFDESLVRNQDDELNLRIVRSGGKIWQDPAIVSWYSPRPRLSSLFRQYFQYGFWKVAVIRKHRLPASWRHLVPASFVLINAVLITALLASIAMGSGMWTAISTTIWVAVLASYSAALLLFSMTTASQAGWGTLPYLPAVFAAYHLSYGLGFLFGLRWLVAAPTPTRRESIFTSLTR
jgi:glycosyltransferase involved in cell wall biosynthesis